jgi:hypothetical protein
MPLSSIEQKRLEDLRVKQGLTRLSSKEQDEMIDLINKKKQQKPAQDSNSMFTVDLEFRDGRRLHPQFVTRHEAVAFAGRMAMDGRIARSEVRLGKDSQWYVPMEHTGEGKPVWKGARRGVRVEAASEQEAIKKAEAENPGFKAEGAEAK